MDHPSRKVQWIVEYRPWTMGVSREKSNLEVNHGDAPKSYVNHGFGWGHSRTLH